MQTKSYICKNCDRVAVDCEGNSQNTCPKCDQPQTWTLTITAQVFAGDMDKQNVIDNAQQLLENMTDGSDFIGITVDNAERDMF